MATKRLHQQESEVRGFFETILANEMPEVWAVVYTLALIFIAIFLLSG